MKFQYLLRLFILPVLLFNPIGNSGYVYARQEPSITIVITPASINIGGTAAANVFLNNVPNSGIGAAEFTCTYNENLVQVSNIAATALFGMNAVTAINGPQGGKFIFAIVGSKGNKAAASGIVFTFNVKGLQAGQIAIGCTARILNGDHVLSQLPVTDTSFSITESVPSLTPFTPTATITPTNSTAYDFVANACSATWYSGAGQLPCPGIDGSPQGFVLMQTSPKLEDGTTSTHPGLLTFPQNVNNGYIQGIYPVYRVKSGDRFRATIGCELEAVNCYIVYRLDYSIPGSSELKTFWAFVEKYDGFPYHADIDLSALAGQDVKFILTILSTGSPIGDRALWIHPIIYQTDLVSTPTTPSDSTLTGQVLAKKPVTVSLYQLNDSLVSSVNADSEGRFSFKVPAGTYYVVTSANGSLNARGSITLPSTGITNMQTITLFAGDIDGNNIIDQYDALTIGMNYNGSTPTIADLNNDGIINILDLEILAINYQKSSPLPWN